MSIFKKNSALYTALLLFFTINIVHAQTKSETPALFDHRAQNVRTQAGDIHQIRFLTESDYPPFDFLRSDGELSGFNIDLARAICDDLKATCTIQPWRWDKLDTAMDSDAGDAVIASLKQTPQTAAHYIFTMPYYLTPARFAVLKNSPLKIVSAQDLSNKSIGVVSGSAHEAYFRLNFPTTLATGYSSLSDAEEALRSGKVEALFADGPSLAIWLAGAQGDCCTFSGGAYYDSAFFSDGARIALLPKSEALRDAINASLIRLDASGKLAELTRKYFPVSFY